MADIISGKNPIIQAIKANRKIEKILLAKHIKKQTEQEIRHLLKHRKTPIEYVDRHVLDKLTSSKHQGIVAYVAPYQYVSVQDILTFAKEKNELPFIIILDELKDPHNLGAILRSVDAVGAHGVIIPKHRAVGLTETVAKASAGAIEHVRVAQVTNIARTIDTLKEENIWIVGAAGEAKEDFRSLDGKTAIALVIGNEGRGISRLVKEKCDWLVRIPMQGHITSLNASVAASLLLFEIYRKRNPIGE